jgi:hypothetical protein
MCSCTTFPCCIALLATSPSTVWLQARLLIPNSLRDAAAATLNAATERPEVLAAHAATARTLTHAKLKSGTSAHHDEPVHLLHVPHAARMQRNEHQQLPGAVSTVHMCLQTSTAVHHGPLQP